MSAITAGSIEATDQRRPLVPSAVLGMLIFIAAEVMFFAAFVSAHMVVKGGSPVWPPLDQPRLPVVATLINTAFLLLSGWLTFVANRAFRAGNRKAAAVRWFGLAMLSGTFFVALQGVEWARLLHYGLTMHSSVYGSFFYLIIGAHALHAIGALIFMLVVFLKLRAGSMSAEIFWAAQALWYFVVGVWPLLFVVVYLN